MRVCIFGGTFDPPHIGHLMIAQTVCEAENFDKILFMPANKPPHKKSVSRVEDRLAMLNIAIEGNPNFEISDMEIKRGGVSYTIDTLNAMKSRVLKKEDDLFYLIGSDSLLDLSQWKEPRQIMKKCNVVVAIRPGFRPSDIPAWILHSIQFANIPRFEISSSNIRARWRENKTIRYLVTLPVWEYINQNQLYS